MSGRKFSYDSNSNIMGAILERFRRSLKTRMYKYLTKNNSYSYLDVMNKLLIGYNKSVHSTIGMPPRKFTAPNVYSVWRKVNSLRAEIPQCLFKFDVGDFVRITKDKVRFAKGFETAFLTENFVFLMLFSSCRTCL